MDRVRRGSYPLGVADHPYAPDRSTFLIETDGETWRRAGFDISTDATDLADSDEVSLRYLETAFAETLQQHGLIGNRTRWLQFRTVTCRRWSTGNVVLLGDAAHTAHYSIGSGTKLAMEEAIALDATLSAATTVDDALAECERIRRPAVEHLQQIAKRSEHWWESFPQRMDLPVEQLMVAYMTRAGKVGLGRFLESAPEVAWAGIAAYGGVDAGFEAPVDVVDWVLNRPLEHGGRRFDDRTAPPSLRDEATTTVLSVDVESAWDEKATALVDEVRASAAVWLTGPDDRAHVLTRIDLAERMLRSTGALMTVDVPAACLPDAAAGLVSVRTHLVSVTS